MKKIISMVISLATVITIFSGCSKEEVYRLIKVNSFEGAVTVEREEKMEVFEGLQLISEDSVEVGDDSLLELLADSDKHIVAEENTAFKLHSTGTETGGNITVDLLYGKALFTIDNKLPDGSTFEVNTPNASLSVRGTVFSAEYDSEKKETVVEVIEGIVLVAYNGGEELIEKGRTIIIKEVDGEIQIETDIGEADIGVVVTTTTDVSATTPVETTTVSETTAEETTTADTTVTTTAETTEAVITTTSPATTTAGTTTAATTTKATTTKEKVTKATTTKAKTTTAEEISETEADEEIVDENQNIGYLSIGRYFQLTGDDSYQTLEADYYHIATATNSEGATHTNHLLGMTANVELYNDSYNFYIESPYLSDVLNELKPYIESHVDEINTFFEENKDEVMKKCKEEDRSAFNYTYASMEIDWLPDTITIKNETGSYLMNVTTQSVNLAPTCCSVEVAPSTSSLISDYFITASPISYVEGDVMYYIDNVSIYFGGTIEKIS